MEIIFIFWSKVKFYIKRNHQKLFLLLKKIATLPIFYFINKKLSSPTERFDPRRENAEFEYFDIYSKLIIDHILKSIDNNNLQVLDIGSGFGYLTKKIADLSQVADVVAIDKIKPGKFHFFYHPKIHYFKKDIRKLYQKPADPLFNIVISTEFIEHIPENDLRNILPWIKSVMVDGGIFIGSTPNNPTNNITFTDCPYHVREYNVEYFKDMLKEFGFNNISIFTGQGFFIWKAYK